VRAGRAGERVLLLRRGPRSARSDP
jgi:hypothetical protein